MSIVLPTKTKETIMNEELKAKLEAAKAKAAQDLANRKEELSLKLELTKIESPLYQHRELLKDDNAKLDAITDVIVEQYNADDRKMSLTFGYGLVPNKILTILKSIQYSKHENKTELLMITGLDEAIVEDTLDAFGNTAYYSKANIEVVEAIPMDIVAVKDRLNQVAIDMGLLVKLDLSKFNKANVDYQYKSSEVKAGEMLENTLKYLNPDVAYEE